VPVTVRVLGPTERQVRAAVTAVAAPLRSATFRNRVLGPTLVGFAHNLQRTTSDPRQGRKATRNVIANWSALLPVRLAEIWPSTGHRSWRRRKSPLRSGSALGLEGRRGRGDHQLGRCQGRWL